VLLLALLSALAIPGDLQLHVVVQPAALTISVENAATPVSVSITVPAGYRVAIPAPGSTVGTVRGQAAKIGDVHSLVRLDGQLTAAAPGLADACDPGPHRAVWQVQLRQGDTFPVFVDDTAAGAFVLRYCPPLRPDGGRIFQLSLTFRGIFTSPTARGTYGWRVVMDTSSMATYEARASVPVPNRLVLKARVVKGVLVVTGRVDRPRALQVLLSARRTRSLFSAIVKTNARGLFTYRRRVNGPLTITAVAATQNLGCSEPCLSSLVMPPPAVSVRVR
jgi:hypothetical protein